MRQSEYDEILKTKDLSEVIEILEKETEEEYNEQTMLWLAENYLKAGDEKRAGKIARKYRTLFPAGDFLNQMDALFSSDAKENAAAPVIDNRVTEQDPVPESGSLSSLVASKGKEKTETKIPENILAYFTDVVGMKNIQLEMDKFYKLLRFEYERKDNDFNSDLIKSTHFLISGSRGSGKTMLGEILAKMLFDFGVRGNAEPVQVAAQDLADAYNSDTHNGLDNLFSKLKDVTVIVENIQDIVEGTDQSGQGSGSRQLLSKFCDLLKQRQKEISVIITGSDSGTDKMLALCGDIQDAVYGRFCIERYSSLELLEIMKKLARKSALRINPEADRFLLRKINAESKASTFSNAITLGRYIKDATVKMAQRYYEVDDDSDSALAYLMPSDFEMDMDEESLEELLAKLDAMVGLAGVKEQVRKRVESMLIEKKAEEAGAERKVGHGSLHMMFTGNPGTGKTTVAAIIGKIYQQLGVLPNGSQLVSVSRSDLVGQYQGHTAQRVKEKVQEAMGGILFVDEAYALCTDDNDSFGHEAVNELILQMENNKDSMIVILAGYKKEMEEFLKSNSGFKSRIRNVIEFEDYTVEEMTKIFYGMAEQGKRQIEPGCENDVFAMLEEKSKVPDFGNARGVRNIFEEVCEEADSRLVKLSGSGQLSASDLDTITLEDIRAVSGRKSYGEKSLDDLLNELNSLTGLTAVKNKVQEMIDDILVKNAMKERGLNVDENNGTLHLVFKGNAGTGKTTVARLLGQIYCKLGVLKKNVFVETGRKDLVGQYEGHTAPLVIKKCDEADGGILFIDEAYSLVQGERDSFGKEAVTALVAELENRRNRLMVILAGYDKDMDAFLDTNQGLASRLSNEIIFEDYTDDELVSIFRGIIAGRNLKLEDGIDDVIRDKICRTKASVKDFGNGRGVRNIVDTIEKKKNSRLASLMRSGARISEEDMVLIVKEDFE